MLKGFALPICTVKQHWAWLVLGWVTAWEQRVLLATVLGSSSGKALGYGLDGPGSFPGGGGVEIFLHSVSRLVL